MKGPSSFSALSHSSPAGGDTTFHADLAPVIAAIGRLEGKLDREIRVDLPAMNPSFSVPDFPPFPEVKVTLPEMNPVFNQAPISVTVPDFPPFPEIRIPAVQVTVPDFPPVQLELSYGKVAMIACLPPIVYLALQYAISAAIRFF